MRNFLILFFISLLLPQFSQAASPTIEEQVIMNSFALYQTALVYDEVCNGHDPKDRYDLKKPENVRLLGNEQLLAARFGGVEHGRFPDKSVDEMVAKMTGFSKMIKGKAKETLDSKGCDSEAAQSGEKALKLFTTVIPAQLNELLDAQIKKQGGTVTSLGEIEGSTGKSQ